MKRTIITTILLTLVAVSCHNELAPEMDSVGDMIDITVEAVVNDEDASTRTSLGGSNADTFREVLWDKGDEIAFFADGASSFSKFVNLNEEDAQLTAVFAGSVQESEDYAAFYPYSSAKSLGSGKVYFTLPAIQTYVADDFAANMSPMVGRLTDGRLSFKNLCGIFVLNLMGEGKVSSITFKGYDASGDPMPVSGDASVNYTYSSAPSLNLDDAEGYSVTLDCGNGVSLNSDKPTPFHILLPPGEYHSFALNIGMTDGRVMKKKGTRLMLVERSLRTRSAALTFVESEVINLSKSGAANSYIVSKAGDYRFKAVKGNGSESVGTVASVEVLWESFGTSVTPSVGDLIETVNFNDGYVVFSTASSFKEGNAVVAAKNSSGEILWSWHIWLTDQPSEQEYNNNAGTMMDRNLGATSATPGDVGALGLLYQWGRKDPFLGSSSITSTFGNTVWAKSTGTWPSAVSSSLNRGTIDYVTKNPMTFVTYNTSNYDWYYTGTKSTDDSRWGQDKTIYDPCPYGWRVPDGGTNSIWKVAGFTHTLYDDSNEGIKLNISNSSVTWYPACGSIGDGSGTLDSVGYGAKCWSVTPLKNYAYVFAYNDRGYVYPSDNCGRSGGYSVRCYKEDSGNPMIPEGPSADNATDLASDGETANSYIVSKSGTYKFKPVKGNSSTSVGTVSSVEVLWESFGTSVTPSVGDLIEAVNYDAGYVVFSTPSSFKEGNAVIAAKNSSGEILWSWHIWLTDQPSEQEYYNNAGIMMDRNLGATSATPGNVGALGLLYQWGRKDPFLGSSSISSNVEAESTAIWPSVVYASTSKGTVEYVTANPMTFIKATDTSEYDWHYSSRNNDLWKSSKTIYDPCPAGWRVPDGGSSGVWAKACGSSSSFADYPYDSTDEGMNFSGKFGRAAVIWYPASGERDGRDGLLYYQGSSGAYWAIPPEGYYYPYNMGFYDSGAVFPSSGYCFHAYGQSVRCLKEGTGGENSVPEGPSADNATDLASDGETANSYIVSKSGTYKFKPVKGNSSTSVGTVSSVEVLWESFGTSVTPSVGDLIEAVNYDAGYVVFSTPSSFKEGNAVIAVKNSSGEILWSWHIWLTDQPSEQEYYNNAGIMMDRNLGATSATPGNVGALGLLYQWGRKDPFLGSSSISESIEAKSTGTWPSSVTASTSKGNVDYATANPMTFILGTDSSDSDWHYSSRNNDLWKSSKTIYDPCPAGWRVPDGGDKGVWSKACGSSDYFSDYPYDSTDEGMNFSGKFGSASVIWYPASGCRRYDDGSLITVGRYGYYWSVAPISNFAYGLDFHSLGYVNPSDRDYRAFGQVVRCLKEGTGGENSVPEAPSADNATDLASDGETANSYIVSKSGTYKFKPVKGNSSTSVGTVSSVEVLWESFGTSVTPSVGDLIEAVNYDAGYVVFSTPSSFKEGNAVIAAKNSSGEILWSWHIWLTDQPKGQTYYNNAGTMMDRNLGATSATPGDVGALGLLYQWGRKDPFLGSSSISESIEAKSTGTWSSVAASTSKGNMGYATANPTTFITGGSSSDWDWHYSSRNNELWKPSKTIYDPCPAGWRVPGGGGNGVWSTACGQSASFADYPYDSTDEGMNFSGKFGSASVIWYPASGYRDRNDGSLYNVGNYGYYWSVTPSSSYAYSMYFGYYDGVHPSNGSHRRAYGHVVRCLQE